MQNNDFEKFARLMATLAETFGNTSPSEQKIEIYYRALSDLTIEQVDAAVINLVKTRTITSTLPVPAEIRDVLGAGKGDALLALKKAENAVERHGSYTSVVFDDPVIHMVIASMGGWPKFCCPSAYGDDQQWQWKQKEFMSLYEAFSKNPKVECPLQLSGICDSYNSANGFDKYISKPAIIGDERKAIEWQEQHAQKRIEKGTSALIPDRCLLSIKA